MYPAHLDYHSCFLDTVSSPFFIIYSISERILMISCATTWTRLARKGNSGLITKAGTDQQTFNLRDEDHAPEKTILLFLSFSYHFICVEMESWKRTTLGVDVSSSFSSKKYHAVAELTRALMLETGLLQQYFF